MLRRPWLVNEAPIAILGDEVLARAFLLDGERTVFQSLEDSRKRGRVAARRCSSASRGCKSCSRVQRSESSRGCPRRVQVGADSIRL